MLESLCCGSGAVTAAGAAVQWTVPSGPTTHASLEEEPAPAEPLAQAPMMQPCARACVAAALVGVGGRGCGCGCEWEVGIFVSYFSN